MKSSLQKTFACIGTYTQNGSKGIYLYEMEPDTGKLTPAGTFSGLENPSYLTASGDGRFLYAVSETESTGGIHGGAATAFMVERNTGRLMLLNTESTRGIHPCHLAADKSNKYLFAANYSEGSLIAYKLQADGSIGPVAAYLRHHGSGPDPERQEKAHVHFTALTPDEHFLCTIDLGTDCMTAYTLDGTEPGKLLREAFTVPVTPGSGPRHLAFSPDGKFAWLVNELSSDVVGYQYDKEIPSFEELQRISSLPEEFAGKSYCAAIKVSPDGGFLYVSNRGHDSIAVYKIDKNSGRLGQPQFVSSGGSWPRDITLDPSGRFLFAANQYGGTVVTFSIQPETGLPVPTAEVLAIPDPTCILFLRFD